MRRDRPRIAALLTSVYELFPVLFDDRRRLSSFSSGGEQQMVAIGRMLMSDPDVGARAGTGVAIQRLIDESRFPRSGERRRKTPLPARRGGLVFVRV